LNLLSTGRNTAYDKILKFYQNPDKNIKLTEKQVQLKNYYELANSLLTEHTPKQAADILRRRYENKMSRATSYRIVTDAMNLFGDIKKSSKEGLRNLLIERQLMLAQKAEKDGDFRTAEKCYSSVAKMGGLNDEEIDLTELYKSLQLPAILFTTNPEALKQLPEEPETIDISHEQ
jgi:hypothetical protein